MNRQDDRGPSAPKSAGRRLAAILAADVAGYTRLVEQNTTATVAAWQTARDEVIDPSVAEHEGRIVKLTGDGFLSEFPTVEAAVKCAISIQERLLSSPLPFRMGVSIGDIIDDGRDIHGEGINIAARLESIAEPGGILISGDVFNLVRNRIDETFLDLGQQTVKHVSQPVRIYAVGRFSSGREGQHFHDEAPVAEYRSAKTAVYAETCRARRIYRLAGRRGMAVRVAGRPNQANRPPPSPQRENARCGYGTGKCPGYGPSGRHCSTALSGRQLQRLPGMSNDDGCAGRIIQDGVGQGRSGRKTRPRRHHTERPCGGYLRDHFQGVGCLRCRQRLRFVSSG